MLETLSRLATKQRHSVWIGGLDHSLMTQGLAALAAEGVSGVLISHEGMGTTNGGDELHNQVREMIIDLVKADPGLNPATVDRWLMVQEARSAADQLARDYVSTRKRDGYCSIPIPGDMLGDERSIIEAARSLYFEVDRPNLMVEIPGTDAGIGALEQLIAEGISVNISPVVEPEQHQRIMSAYARGIARNDDPDQVASVSTVPVDEITARVDLALGRVGDGKDKALRGQGGVACGERLYRQWKAFFDSPDFHREISRGGRPQRIMWGLEGTPEVDCVGIWSSLIYPETLALVDMPTLEGYLQRGELRPVTHSGVEGDMVDRIQDLGVDVEVLCTELEMELIEKHQAEFEKTIHQLARQL